MKTVKVEISLEERVKYHRYTEMSQADFDRINKALDSDSRVEADRAAEELRGMINPARDVFDADDLEVNEFRLQALPAEEKTP